MAEAFPVSGNIEPASFPYLLVDLHRHAATGSLKVTGPVHPKALYFRGGRILFGSSNDPHDQLGAILIESGRITREQLDEVNAQVGPGNPLAKVLAESGFVNQREIGDAARVKLERILADVISWETGSFEFEDGVLPKGAVDLKLSTERLVLSAVQRVTSRAFALRHVELSTVLEPLPDGESALGEMRAEVWPLLERLDGRRSLKDAVSLTRLDEFEAAKTACALLFLGVVRKVAAGAGEELDLAEQAQSAFSEEPPMYTVPLEAVSPPAEAEPTGFAFAEPEPSGFSPSEPEPPPDSAAETVMFPFPQAFPEAEPTPEPVPEPVPVTPEPEPVAPFVPFAPEAEPPAPSFHVEAEPRAATDTIPGDEPAYEPPAPSFVPPEPPAPAEAPEIGTPPAPPSSRPSQEDLAALDALLNPSASARLAESPVERPRTERWEPQSRPPTTPPRRPVARPASAASASSSKVLFIAAGLSAVVLATLAAWYFLLRTPSRPGPQAAATPVAAPPSTTQAPAATPEPAPTIEPPPVEAEEAVASPAPAVAVPATPAPTPVPTPTPVAPTRPAPPAAAPAAATGDGRVLLQQGDYAGAARSFAAALAPGAAGRFSLQVAVACATENVQKAVSAVPAEEFFVLPVSVRGRACYRLCWGVYGGRPEAEAARSSLPAYFRDQGVVPRVAALPELLP